MGYLAIIHVAGDHTAVEGVMSDEIVWPDGTRLVGVFRYPTKDEIGCTGCSRGNNPSAWGRGRGGFMRCGVCGKRNKNIRRFLINALFDYLGANLMEDPPVSFRTPEGYGDFPR